MLKMLALSASIRIKAGSRVDGREYVPRSSTNHRGVIDRARLFQETQDLLVQLALIKKMRHPIF